MPRSREIKEWIGRNDDAMPSDTVRRRLRNNQGDRCAECGIQFGAGIVAHCDHIVPLIDHGENRETNLQMLCADCHKAKTSAEASRRKKERTVRDKHTLARQPSKWPKQRLGNGNNQHRATSRSDKFNLIGQVRR